MRFISSVAGAKFFAPRAPLRPITTTVAHRSRGPVRALLASVAVGALALLAPGHARALPGDLYVAEWENQTIEKITPGGVRSVFANASSGLNYPYALTFDRNGNLFVANEGGSIEKFTSTGAHSVFATLKDPLGLAFDASGNLYVSNWASTGFEIDKITPGGSVSIFATAGLNRPEAVAVDRAGNVYVANGGDNSIEKYTPGGVASLFASNYWHNGPSGFAFDAAGNLYASVAGYLVEKITPVGAMSDFAAPSDPRGLAFDSSGNLFVSRFNYGQIDRITPGGVETVFAANLAGRPLGIAFEPTVVVQPVPEPVGVAVLATGVLGLGSIRARRRFA